jgi:hypothetical protein
MRQASCCRCSSGSWISGMVSWAEQWRRKFRVESNHALSRYGRSISGCPRGEKDTPAITWYHCKLIWRRLLKGPGVRRCLMMRSVCTIPCSKNKWRHPRPPYQTDRNTIERGVFLLYPHLVRDAFIAADWIFSHSRFVSVVATKG